MIQRIQSIYLLAIIILMALCIYMPIAEFTTSSGQLYQFSMAGFFELYGNVKGQQIQSLTSLMVSGYLMIGLALVTLFLYKVRRLQMRLAIYSIILLIGMGFIFLYIIKSVKNEMGGSVYYHVNVLFPFIGAVLAYLAFRSIKKDEETVKSFDRIR